MMGRVTVGEQGSWLLAVLPWRLQVVQTRELLGGVGWPNPGVGLRENVKTGNEEGSESTEMGEWLVGRVDLRRRFFFVFLSWEK